MTLQDDGAGELEDVRVEFTFQQLRDSNAKLGGVGVMFRADEDAELGYTFEWRHDTACATLTARHNKGDDPEVLDSVADRSHDLPGEPGAVLHRSSVGVLSTVSRRGEKLGQQIAVCAVELHSIKSCAL